MALERDGQIVAGVTYNPITNELYWAEKGRGCFLNDKRLRVAARRELGETVLATGIPFMGKPGHAVFLKELHQIAQKVSGVRRFGSAALDLAYVAAGRFDGFWERGLGKWDVAAGILFVTEAGGTVSDADGGSDPLNSGTILVSNPDLHPLILAQLRRRRLRPHSSVAAYLAMLLAVFRGTPPGAGGQKSPDRRRPGASRTGLAPGAPCRSPSALTAPRPGRGPASARSPARRPR